MLNVSKESKLKPQEAIKRAMAYFGPGGLGLEVKEEDKCYAYLEGGGGSVRVNAATGKKGSTVDVESVEWDYQVKEFLNSLK
jgi:hypothetical protein